MATALRRIGMIFARAAVALLFVVTTVILAKVAQYAMVDWLGGRIGFALASMSGLALVMAPLVWITQRRRARLRE